MPESAAFLLNAFESCKGQYNKKKQRMNDRMFFPAFFAAADGRAERRPVFAEKNAQKTIPPVRQKKGQKNFFGERRVFGIFRSTGKSAGRKTAAHGEAIRKSMGRREGGLYFFAAKNTIFCVGTGRNFPRWIQFLS